MNNSICFFIQNLTDIPTDNDWLSPGEKETLSRLRFPKRRKDWLLGRWTAKCALRGYLGFASDMDLSLIEIRAAVDGAPEAFLNNAPAGAAVSISHAGNRSFCAAGSEDMAFGCDIEQLEPRDEIFIADYFVPEEIERVRQALPENRTQMTNLIWSAKESMLKALREGLRRDTRSVLVQPEDGESPNVWNPWRGRCLQSNRVFYGRWRTLGNFVYTVGSNITFILEETL